MRHSNFEDVYKGQKFIVRVSSYDDAFTIELEVRGFPPHKDSDNVWKTREEAINAGIKEAKTFIDGMNS